MTEAQARGIVSTLLSDWRERVATEGMAAGSDDAALLMAGMLLYTTIVAAERTAIPMVVIASEMVVAINTVIQVVPGGGVPS